MAALPTETYIDPGVGGNDHGGAAFVDGSFANATNTLTKVGAFPAATCQAGDKLYLTDNGSAEVTAGLYTISARTNDDNVVLTADIRSGAPDPTDVVCAQHTGAIGLPWNTLQHSLDFTTRDAANGDRFNLKSDQASQVTATIDDVLGGSALSFATYGTPTISTPAVVQGYSATAGDGGIGGIDADAGSGVIGSPALDYVQLIDLRMHNTGATQIVRLDNSNTLIRCELDTSTHVTAVDMDNSNVVIDCAFHNCGGLSLALTNVVWGNTFLDIVAGASQVVLTGASSVVAFNVMEVPSTATYGIDSSGSQVTVLNNSIWAAGANTDAGIRCTGNPVNAIVNNVIEGFSGAGGLPIDMSGRVWIYGGNQFYNNTTDAMGGGGTILLTVLADVTNGASAFANAAGDNFELVAGAAAEAWPSTFREITTDQFMDPGAVQREEAGGGGGGARNPLQGVI